MLTRAGAQSNSRSQPGGSTRRDLRYTYAVSIVLHRRQITPFIAAFAYLAAAVAPCPPSVDELQTRIVAPLASQPVQSPAAVARAHDAGHDHHHPQTPTVKSDRAETQPTSHHHREGPDHPQDAGELSGSVAHEETVAAPCPCGCGKRAGNGGIAKRLGPLVLSSADPTPVSGSAQAQHWLIQWVPDSPPSLPDTIPIST